MPRVQTGLLAPDGSIPPWFGRCAALGRSPDHTPTIPRRPPRRGRSQWRAYSRHPGRRLQMKRSRPRHPPDERQRGIDVGAIEKRTGQHHPRLVEQRACLFNGLALRGAAHPSWTKGDGRPGANARQSTPQRTGSMAASMASARRSTISSTCLVVTMKGGASSTWSPCTPSMVPPIG